MFSRVVFHFFPWHDLKNLGLHFISQSTEVITPIAQQKQCTSTYKSCDPRSNFITKIIFTIISHSPFIQFQINAEEQNKLSSHSGAFIYNFVSEIQHSSQLLVESWLKMQVSCTLSLLHSYNIMSTKITTTAQLLNTYKLLQSMSQIDSQTSNPTEHRVRKLGLVPTYQNLLSVFPVVLVIVFEVTNPQNYCTYSLTVRTYPLLNQ